VQPVERKFDAKEFVHAGISKSLGDFIDIANQYLTATERAKVLIEIGKKMNVNPNDLVRITLEYKY
jgi:hypothetical protein